MKAEEYLNSTWWLSRTELLLGEEGLQKLASANVLVIGLGGVGAYAAEMLCRAGIGKMTIIDGDNIEPTNINRQLPALTSTIGIPKAEVLMERFMNINPRLKLDARKLFVRDELTDEILESCKYDYVVDAIDSLSPKVNLVSKCIERGIPVISSMGSGGKLDPSKIEVADISRSYNCKLAKAMRKRLHRRGIRKGLKVVFSSEEIPDEAVFGYDCPDSGMTKSMVGTISFMPAIFGCFCASVVIRDLLEKTDSEQI
ncbi:MAG: tRNA threonylcarbamoyladenosine dehydratase [Victivallales bacterium]|nr:tRNA threonylcarbamoyladenosine dehydratase [Victivallales bacterium]